MSLPDSGLLHHHLEPIGLPEGWYAERRRDGGRGARAGNWDESRMRGGEGRPGGNREEHPSPFELAALLIRRPVGSRRMNLGESSSSGGTTWSAVDVARSNPSGTALAGE